MARRSRSPLDELSEFEALYRRHATVTLRFFIRRCADRETAMDLWEETWARALEDV